MVSPTSIAILLNPEPSNHIVYPCTDEAHIAKAVGLFAGSGLATLQAAGQLVCCEAEKLLSRFMV
jgi:hypothetical protein